MEITREEIVQWMMDDAPMYVDYWIRNGYYDGGKRIYVIMETVDDWVELNGAIILTLEDVDKAIDQWCNECAKGHPYDYYDRFAKDWLWGDYAAVDYDAGVVDQIIQWAAFGEVRYG